APHPARGQEGKGEEPPFDPRLVELEVGGKEHGTDPFVAEEIGQVEVEGQDAEVRAVLGVGPVEDEREEGEGGRPLRGARAWRGPVAGGGRGGRRAGGAR